MMPSLVSSVYFTSQTNSGFSHTVFALVGGTEGKGQFSELRGLSSSMIFFWALTDQPVPTCPIKTNSLDWYMPNTRELKGRFVPSLRVYPQITASCLCSALILYQLWVL